MKWNKIMIALLIQVIFVTVIHAAVTETYPFQSSDDASRFDSLTREIRCVVCQNQSIADSNAPLANDLRSKVYQMVLEKKTDDAIKQYLLTRYGDFILLKPRVTPLTAILWLFPFIAVLLIFPLLIFLFRRAR